MQEFFTIAIKNINFLFYYILKLSSYFIIFAYYKNSIRKSIYIYFSLFNIK